MTGLLELLISTVALLVLSDASFANYLEHFNEQPCSRNFENLLLIFGDIARRWYFLFVFVESDP